jgi:hypothetical protein
MLNDIIFRVLSLLLLQHLSSFAQEHILAFVSALLFGVFAVSVMLAIMAVASKSNCLFMYKAFTVN